MKADARYRLRAHNPEAASNLTEFDKHIAKHGPASFMVIKAGGGVLSDPQMIDSFSFAVAELADLGLTPLVVHGGGAQIDKRLDEEGIQSGFIDGLRITSDRAMDTIATVLDEINADLVDRIKAWGRPAAGITRAFEAEYLAQAKYDRVGAPTGVDGQEILEAMSRNQVPVISSIGRIARNGTLLNINADTAAADLAHTFRPLNKFVSVTRAGGVRDENGEIISEITPAYLDRLEQNGTIDGGMLLKARTGMQIVEANLATDVVIVSPFNILTELFTKDGTGTLIRNDFPPEETSDFSRPGGL